MINLRYIFLLIIGTILPCLPSINKNPNTEVKIRHSLSEFQLLYQNKNELLTAENAENAES